MAALRDAKDTPFADDLGAARGAQQATTTPSWITGAPMDPLAVAVEPVPAIPGFPFLHRGAAALVSGPTGGGRSSLVQACAYDASRSALNIAYLGAEVTEGEFNARAADLASRRRDPIDQALTADLAHVRYLSLVTVITRAWASADEWINGIAAQFDVVAIDPISSVASALDFDFDKSNAEFVTFYDRLIQPLVDRGVAVLLLDNIGHATEARSRAKGASAKQDRADLTFSCVLKAHPASLIITARKVRSVRAPFKRGDEWLFDRETQTVTRQSESGPGEEAWKPTTLMERVSLELERDDGLSRNEIRKRVEGKASYIDQAIAILVDDQHVDIQPDGKANRHHLLTPYRVPESQPSPNQVPDPVEEPGPTESLYVVGDEGAGPGSTAHTTTDRVPQNCTCSRPAPSPPAGNAHICATCKKDMRA